MRIIVAILRIHSRCNLESSFVKSLYFFLPIFFFLFRRSFSPHFHRSLFLIESHHLIFFPFSWMMVFDFAWCIKMITLSSCCWSDRLRTLASWNIIFKAPILATSTFPLYFSSIAKATFPCKRQFLLLICFSFTLQRLKLRDSKIDLKITIQLLNILMAKEASH